MNEAQDPLDIEKTLNCPGANPSTAALNPGDTFGQYRIIRRLGQGGMGDVYEAEHTILAQSYALKLLPPDFAAMPGSLERFRREARVMSKLKHPHIVRVDEFSETDGRYWLRMELIGGLPWKDAAGNPIVTLQDLAKAASGKLPQRVVLNIFTQVVEALAHAHAHGAVHRDLKPSNILLSWSGDVRPETAARLLSDVLDDATAVPHLHVRIADFGLVHLLSADTAERPLSLGRSGDWGTMAPQGAGTAAMVGTYDYMSPEQKRGVEVDRRTDFYSLGVMIYQLLTGRRLGMKRPSQIDPELIPEWDELVTTCVQDESAKRYADAEALREALAGIRRRLSGDKIVASAVVKKPVFGEGLRFWPYALALVLLVGVSFGISRLAAKRSVTTPSQPTASTTANTTLTAPPSSSAGLPSNLRQGLRLYFDFDRQETGDVVTDLSGNGHQGKVTGAKWTVDGRQGGAYRFASTENYITVPNSPSLAVRQITLAAWIKTVWSDNVWRRIIDKQRDHGFAMSIGGAYTGNGQETSLHYEGRATSEINGKFFAGDAAVTDDQWHHLVTTFDGMEQKLYVDGKLQGESRRWDGDVEANAYDLTIGANRSNPNPNLEEVGSSFVGTIDEVMMYDRALTETEVRQLFGLAGAVSLPVAAAQSVPAAARTAETVITTPAVTGALAEPVGLAFAAPSVLESLRRGLVLHFSFDNIQGDQVIDDSGIGNNGTRKSATVTSGVVGNALAFDDGDAVVTVPDHPSLNPEKEVTLAAWIRGSPYQPSGWPRIIDKLSFDEKLGFNLIVHPQLGGAGGFHVFQKSNATEHGITAVSDDVVLDDRWHHLVGSFDGTQLRYYVDGTLQHTTFFDEQIAIADRALTIGNGIGLNPFRGAIDEVAVFNRALSDDDVKQLYELEKSGQTLVVVRAPQTYSPPVGAPAPAPSAWSSEPIQTETIGLGGGVKMEFVRIPPGSLKNGSDFFTKPFYMGKYKVTQAQWQAIMGRNPSHFKGPQLPVESVTWYDCQDFLKKLQAQNPEWRFSLPTRAQWEYAARAGATSQRYHFGDDAARLGEYAWYAGNSGDTTHPVGKKKPNAWGLYDIHGNVWEWSADQSPPSTTHHFLKGGAWNRPPGALKFASAGNYRGRTENIGFRMAMCRPAP